MQTNVAPSGENPQQQTQNSQVEDVLALLKDPDAGDGTESSERPAFKFDEEFQTQLLGAILKDEPMLAFASSIIDPQQFTVRAGVTLARAAFDYYREYGGMPHRSIIEREVRKKHGDDKSFAAYLGYVSQVYDAYEPGLFALQYFKDQIANFAKVCTFKRLFHDVLKGLDKGDANIDELKANFVKEYERLNSKPTTEYELYTVEELAALPPLTWQVGGHFPKNGTVVVFGPSGACKSFVCLDMGLSISCGLPFLGRHETVAGKVLYLCSEGSHGVRQRIEAWQKGRGVERIDNFVVSKCSHNLQERGEVERLIQKAKAKLGGIDIVFVDTLSRNFGPGDTDNNKDMQVFLASVDFIREQTGATVVSVHHTGWAETKRERGAKSLRDYCDTSILVSKDEKTKLVEIECKKQKDAAEFDAYVLKPVEAEGSMYLEYMGSKAEIRESERDGERQGSTTTEREAEVLAAIPTVGLSEPRTSSNTVTMKQLIEKLGYSRKTLEPILDQLADGQLITKGRLESSSRSPFAYWQHAELAT